MPSKLAMKVARRLLAKKPRRLTAKEQAHALTLTPHAWQNATQTVSGKLARRFLRPYFDKSKKAEFETAAMSLEILIGMVRTEERDRAYGQAAAIVRKLRKEFKV